MALASDLYDCMQRLGKAGAFEIRESATKITVPAPWSWEVRGESEKPLLHVWGENCNLTRRVLAIVGRSDTGITLSVERFGKAKPGRMDLLPTTRIPTIHRLTREEFAENLKRILAEQFPDETVERISTGADLEHTLSGMFTRGIVRRGNTATAFLAVPDVGSPDAMNSALTYGLLWFSRSRQTPRKQLVSGLRLLVPKGASGQLSYRLSAIDPRLSVEVFELDPLMERLERVDPRKNGNVATWLVPRGESRLLLERATPSLAQIPCLSKPEITRHANVQSGEVVLRFHGYSFARWCDGKVVFEVRGMSQEWTPGTDVALQQLIRNLESCRKPLASDTRHELFRAQPERWLQSLIAEDLSRLDINLDPEHLYEQVLANSAGHRGILDLLAVTRNGRLVILELKASECVDLPMQAADYWARIRKHQSAHDLQRYGYFAGMTLQPAPPLVYLISPALRFHPSTGVLLGYLSPEIEVVRIGIAESWRRGIRIMMRQ